MRKTRGEKIFAVINVSLLCLIMFIVLYPLYFSLIASFSSPNAVYQGRVLIWPADITFRGYEKVFSNHIIWQSYLNSLLYTFVGTGINLCMTIPFAFAMSRPEFVGRNIIMKLAVFTMYFYGGIVPLYFVVRDLNLLDTMWSVILPTAIATYNMIIARSFFITSIPEELKEAAFLDGCGYVRYFFYIALRLSKPLLAVMALFYASRHWNNYFDPMIYLQTESKFPLQLQLRIILIDSQNALSQSGDASTVVDAQELVNLLKYTCVIVSSIPMLLLYPFAQKYFVKGMMVGAVKG